MRLKTFCVSAALLLAAAPAFCCGPYWYLPEEYYMFRALDKKETVQLTDRQANCAAWKALCSPSVDEADVDAVVYGYSLEQMKGLLKRRRSSNSFERYIARTKDREIADFLVLAKTCEVTRFEMNDPWYYPSKNDPLRARLEEVISQALSYEGSRLEERYVLQAMRAMFSLGRYAQVDSLWTARRERLGDGVINKMILGYVAGAAYNSGDEETAVECFKASWDLWSLYLHASQYGTYSSMLDYAAQCWPDSDRVPGMLQSVVGGFERKSFNTYDVPDKDEMREYLDICLKGASNAREPGVWYYSAAFLADLLDDSAKASDILARAEACPGSDFLDGSVRVLRMYLDAKTCTYDKAYKDRLFAQVKWLDSKIESGITGNVREITASGWDLHISRSYYYWNDMLRKILIGHVAPRMDKTDPVLALRLRNMADNRLLQIVDRYSTHWYDRDWHDEPRVYTMAQYRAATDIENMFDYSNYFFEALDEGDLDGVIAYAGSVGNGQTEFDRYLDARGYVSRDYVNEVIGTRYLRGRKYAEAAEYLAKVSSKYQERTNVHWYFYREPFSYGPQAGGSKKDYKLDFARQMSSLESQIRSRDTDVRGQALVRYGIGLRSSFDYCWALTQYHLNEGDEWLETAYREKALKDAENYIKQGLRTIKDPEIAARSYVSVCLWESAVEKFPDTDVARELRESCDCLADYKYERALK